jgi:hypothetical protein
MKTGTIIVAVTGLLTVGCVGAGLAVGAVTADPPQRYFTTVSADGSSSVSLVPPLTSMTVYSDGSVCRAPDGVRCPSNLDG